MWVRFEKGTTPVSAVEQQLAKRDVILDELQRNLQRAQAKMKSQANLRRRDVTFSEGDFVYLKLRPYRWCNLATRPDEKLATRVYGPFDVISYVGQVAYKLKLLDSIRLHPVFHVSQLRKAVGANHVVTPPSAANWGLGVAGGTEEVLSIRSTQVGQVHGVEVLIKWKGLPPYEATWEPFELLQQQFPDFHLEDMVTRWVGGIDKPPVRFTYVRRRKKEGNDPKGLRQMEN